MATEDERTGDKSNQAGPSLAREDARGAGDRRPEDARRGTPQREHVPVKYPPLTWQSILDTVKDVEEVRRFANPEEIQALRDKAAAVALAETFSTPNIERRFPKEKVWAELSGNQRLQLAQEAEDKVALIDGREPLKVVKAFLGGGALFDPVNLIIVLDKNEMLTSKIAREDFLHVLAHEQIHAADHCAMRSGSDVPQLNVSVRDALTANELNYHEGGIFRWQMDQYQGQPLEQRAVEISTRRAYAVLKIFLDNNW